MNQSELEALAKVIQAEMNIYQEHNNAKFKALFDMINDKIMPAVSDVKWIKAFGSVFITLFTGISVKVIVDWIGK